MFAIRHGMSQVDESVAKHEDVPFEYVFGEWYARPMGSFASVRNETEQICSKIEQLDERCMAGTLDFDVVELIWDSVYRPEARRLAEAMLPYVPTCDPSLMVRGQVGDYRNVTSDILTTINEPLHDDEIASGIFNQVVDGLRKLNTHLPLETHA